jgi:hypothetical protein
MKTLASSRPVEFPHWEVYFEAKSVFKDYNGYTLKAASAAIHAVKILAKDIIGDRPVGIVGYSDITIYPKNREDAKLLVKQLNERLPKASDSWIEGQLEMHNAFAEYVEGDNGYADSDGGGEPFERIC